MNQITFHCETVTPMFLAGADGRTPELRAPSIKGALRFWWRTVNGHLVKQRNNNWDYSELLKRETGIFGGVNPAQRSKIIIRIVEQKFNQYSFENLNSTLKINSGKNQMSALKYIGYGLFDFKEHSKNRRYIEGSWKMIIQYEKSVEDDLKIALSALNLFGCLGSKARNGFGSIHISSKEFILYSEKELIQGIQNSAIREYSALVNNDFKKIIITQYKMEAINALEEIAVKYAEAKKKVKPNKFIATDKIKNLGFERYPKRYFFSVKKDNNGSYYAQAIYLPMMLNEPNANKKYVCQNNQFQKQLNKSKGNA